MKLALVFCGPPVCDLFSVLDRLLLPLVKPLMGYK